MQEVFEKIVEILENKAHEAEKDMELSDSYADAQAFGGKQEGYENAIEIVKKEAAEYADSWIPCDVEMPEEHDSIFAKYKDTDKWNNQMFEKTSDTVNVTVVDRYGNRTTTHAQTIDGKWSCDLLRVDKSYRIIAWQLLPDPYQK